MSKLEAAITRLDSALAQLESAAGSSAGSRKSDAGWAKERETLLARIAELEEDVRAATSVNEEIESRLDSAMGEIRAALAH